MAVNIITRSDMQVLTINGGSAAARSMSIGSSWTRLRVCAWMGATSSSTIGSTPRWTIGLVSGTTSIYPGNCHLLALQTNSSTNWTIQTAYFSAWASTLSTGRHRFIQKVGASQTTVLDSNNTAGGNLYRASAGSSLLHGFEVEKTSGTTWTMRPFMDTSSATSNVMTRYDIHNLVTAPWNGINFDGHAYYRSDETATVDEATNGVLDSVNIYYDKTSTIEVFELFAYKLS